MQPCSQLVSVLATVEQTEEGRSYIAHIWRTKKERRPMMMGINIVVTATPICVLYVKQTFSRTDAFVQCTNKLSVIQFTVVILLYLYYYKGSMPDFWHNTSLRTSIVFPIYLLFVRVPGVCWTLYLFCSYYMKLLMFVTLYCCCKRLVLSFHFYTMLLFVSDDMKCQ